MSFLDSSTRESRPIVSLSPSETEVGGEIWKEIGEIREREVITPPRDIE